ncbi:type IV secretory pathway TrbL component [Paenochrobactrum gallinarii]|uniref:Type IV secretory pathway TrbL component n=1 Tax=Paenochrobactrum gallinarii TaxID=643673 RepID=A0A841LZ30_9HYPH|nr:hypothetical protein [Paenochrobactrum gallinarii]MBB6261757.1 type IV secretory pathway TrbL component [Paenochrobactrum gallinarii]
MTKLKFITTITEPEIEEKRQREYDRLEKAASGKRGQPPRTARLASFAVFVDYLVSKGIPFASARESRMNRAVLKRHNRRTKKAGEIAKKADEATKKAQETMRAAEEAKGTSGEKRAAEVAMEAKQVAEDARRVSDPRKSRYKAVTPDAIEELLRKIKHLR